MKKLLLPLLAILFLSSCEKESSTDLVTEEIIYENGSATTRSSNKRDVCHNGNIININVNAIPAHQAHGDAVDMDEDGYFYLIDRKRDMYISGGENVYPAEVESVLRNHPAIEDVAIIGVPDESWGEIGCAFVMLQQGADLAPEAVAEFCEGKLAHFKWPKKVIMITDFPRTALGKVRKTILKQDYLESKI